MTVLDWIRIATFILQCVTLCNLIYTGVQLRRTSQAMKERKALQDANRAAVQRGFNAMDQNRREP